MIQNFLFTIWSPSAVWSIVVWKWYPGVLNVIIGESCHKYRLFFFFFFLTHVFVATKYLLWQKYFVATYIILSRQKYCRGKHTFVATNTCLSRETFRRDKNDTCGSSRQWYTTTTTTTNDTQQQQQQQKQVLLSPLTLQGCSLGASNLINSLVCWMKIPDWGNLP